MRCPIRWLAGIARSENDGCAGFPLAAIGPAQRQPGELGILTVIRTIKLATDREIIEWRIAVIDYLVVVNDVAAIVDAVNQHAYAGGRCLGVYRAHCADHQPDDCNEVDEKTWHGMSGYSPCFFISFLLDERGRHGSPLLFVALSF